MLIIEYLLYKNQEYGLKQGLPPKKPQMCYISKVKRARSIDRALLTDLMQLISFFEAHRVKLILR